ncbi:hypothetical protein [Acidicapsa ligni]|uniref:hypothetical protein n=1 Tax=Acidicapsa ligni TaxID=542300 RepID=UPI0021E09C9C|nr:hypothetical protein [Acidicapsa ligni]
MTIQLAIAYLALATASVAQTAVYGHNDKYALPDRSMTPGAVNPAIVGDPSGKSIIVQGVEANICAKGFTPHPYMKVTETIRNQVCEKYAGKGCSNLTNGRINRLIPLEIGGNDTIENLWWQPEPDFAAKDETDNNLKSLVCSGKISLTTAQATVKANWVNSMWVTQSLRKCKNCTVTIAPLIKTSK